MEITTLSLTNFRNYKDINISLYPGLNVLLGKNAQGKTNLLESVFLCAIGKSPRTTKEKDLIKWESSLAKVALTVKKRSGNKKIEVFLFGNQNKAVKINSVSIKRIGELLGEFNAIYFSPDELKLIKESPDERRRFMDIDLCQFDKHYFYNLNKYNKILAQRNKLLKTSKDMNVLKDTVSIWNEQLSEVGSFIVLKRAAFIEKLKPFANDAQQYLTDGKETLDLSYAGILKSEPEKLKAELLLAYENSLEKDYALGYTTVGPHRDDLKITANNIDMRHFGSQGQQRTCALSLKLAELEVFKEAIGEYPVLLLDDVLSELDDDRKLKLLKKAEGFQTILTCTQFNFKVKHKRYIIKEGTAFAE